MKKPDFNDNFGEELQKAYDNSRLKIMECNTEIKKQQAEIANQERAIKMILRRVEELGIKIY